MSLGRRPLPGGGRRRHSTSRDLPSRNHPGYVTLCFAALVTSVAVLHPAVCVRLEDDDRPDSSSWDALNSGFSDRAALFASAFQRFVASSRAAQFAEQTQDREASKPYRARPFAPRASLLAGVERLGSSFLSAKPNQDSWTLPLLLSFVAVMLMTAFLMYRCFKAAEIKDDADRDMCPPALFVSSARGYEGTYFLVSDEKANGLPHWKREGTQDWIFNGMGGQWFIGDVDEKMVHFRCNTGNIASYEEYAGRMPDEIGRGGWLFFDGTDWVEAPDINITSELFTVKDQEDALMHRRNHEAAATKIQSCYRGSSVRRLSRDFIEGQSGEGKRAKTGPTGWGQKLPEALYVTGAKQYSGTYHLLNSGQLERPLWKRSGGLDWIFCGEGGQWLVGDEDEQKQEFLCDTGNIASSEEHAGRLPDEIGPGGWLYFDGNEWHDDPGINITSDLFTAKDQESATKIRERHNDAAVRIQSSIRGSLTRVRLSKSKEACEPGEASQSPRGRAPETKMT